MTTIEATLRSPPHGRSVAWWGVLCAIMTEGTLFIGLLASYFFIWASSDQWPQGGIEKPELGRIAVFTAILLASSAPIFVAERANHRGRLPLARQAMFVSFVMGLSFLINQVIDARDLTFGWKDNAYASIFYATTGLHGLHVLVGLLMSGVVQTKGFVGRLAPRDDTSIEVFALYWHFVDAVWIFVFASLYIAPHLK